MRILRAARRAVMATGAAALVLTYAGTAQAATLRPNAVSGGDGGPGLLPTGAYLTATAAPGSTYQRLKTGLRADGNADATDAVSTALSPDGKTLLVLTSGFNNSINYETGNPILFPVLDPLSGKPATFVNPNTGQQAQGYNQAEFVFVYDVTSGTARPMQHIPIPDTFEGLAWSPQGDRFFVSGGIDDRILIYKADPAKPTFARYQPDAPFAILNHNTNDTAPIPHYDGGLLAGTPAGRAAPALVTGAIAGGLDVSADGKTLVVANFGNASASIVDLSKPTRPAVAEVTFFTPGSAIAQGEYPFAVAVKSDPATGAYQKAYVTSQRDDQVMVMTGRALSAVIPVPNGPNKMALDRAGRTLYVVCGDDDSIVAIDTQTDRVTRRFSLSRPGFPFKGANPDDVTVGPFGNVLYVTLGGENAVAVVDAVSGRVIGRIPVGWYPTSARVSADGSHLFAINEKSNMGPNPDQTYYSHNTPYGISLNKTGRNTYTWEAEKAGLVSMPMPDSNELGYLSRLVDANNGFGTPNDDRMMAFLRTKIKHVIYIVNENRTFDQVLGDIGNGANGDPRLTFFPQRVTPNLHALAANYVTLDNFYDASETSGVGWNWVMQGHTNAFVEETQPVDYGNSNGFGFTYDWQGIVKNMNLGLPATGGSSIFTTRITGILDPTGSSTILPGHHDPSASLGANDLRPGAIGGYIWDDALRHGLTFRNYGWQIDLSYYGSGTAFDPPLVRHPFERNALQSSPSTPSIQSGTDRFYRAFDMRYPDIYREEEWQREFALFSQKGNSLPNLTVMTIPHDHTGGYAGAIEGLGTPTLELADHDYAVGKLVDALTHSKYWSSTAIVMLEDDPQNGQDHVEGHRSIVHIISPYTRAHALVHTTYNSVNALRTVEDLLGLPPLGLNDANAAPMSEVFTSVANVQPYSAIVPGSLCRAPVATDLVPACTDPAVRKTLAVADRHGATWWAKHTASLDFSAPDHLDSAYYNGLLEYGILDRGTLPAAPKAGTVAKSGDGD